MNDADDFVAYPPAVRPLLRADEHVWKTGEGGVEEGLDGGRDEERRREEHREDQHHQANDRDGPSRIGCPERDRMKNCFCLFLVESKMF